MYVLNVNGVASKQLLTGAKVPKKSLCEHNKATVYYWRLLYCLTLYPERGVG